MRASEVRRKQMEFACRRATIERDLGVAEWNAQRLRIRLLALRVEEAELECQVETEGCDFTEEADNG